MAAKMVVPGVTLPRLPAQLTVQPPHWMPMSSALLPTTRMWPFLGRGSTAS